MKDEKKKKKMNDNSFDIIQDIIAKLNNSIYKFALSPYSTTSKNLYSYFYKKNNSDSKSKTHTKSSLLFLSPILLPATAVTTSLSIAACAIEYSGVLVFLIGLLLVRPSIKCARIINSRIDEVLEREKEKRSRISPNS